MIGLAGTGTELLLLQHTKTVWELIPLALIFLSLVLLIFHLIAGGRISIRALQGIMALFVVAGLTGVLLHYQSNVEFKLETNPSLAGWALIWAVLTAKTPPVLAPGAMIQLGLLGFAYSYQHPALGPKLKKEQGRNKNEYD